MTGRLLLGAAGGAMAIYGVVKLVSRPLEDLADAVAWLAGGVVVHDALIAPVVVLAGGLAVRRLPARLRAPSAGAAVVLGTVSVAAVPVLLSLGARADNPTLLDRNYLLGWCVFAAIVVAGALLVAWRGPRTGRKGG